jgi:predicted SAM-dependent methyltransferase
MLGKDPTGTTKEIRLNLGCGGRPLPGYLNIDLDPLEKLKERYPAQEFPDDTKVYNFDIFNLPFRDSSVEEVRAESLLEHLSFAEEPKLLFEVRRVLRPGGLFNFSVPDFEQLFQLWLAAKDEWKDFYRNDPEAIASEHWFGQYSHSMEHRWGYLMASIFGNQNGPGQFHKNCYSVGKVRAILQRVGFLELEISHFLWKGDRDPMIRVRAMKPIRLDTGGERATSAGEG